MRLLLPFALLLTGCGPGLVFNMTPEMTKDQMLARADHIFIGVIEKQEYENWLFLEVPGAKRGDWTILKRQVRIGTVLRGQEPRQSVTIYEYFPTGGLSGDWNSTREGQRNLFLLRVENGRYHLVRDFWRCIFPIYSGNSPAPRRLSSVLGTHRPSQLVAGRRPHDRAIRASRSGQRAGAVANGENRAWPGPPSRT